MLYFHAAGFRWSAISGVSVHREWGLRGNPPGHRKATEEGSAWQEPSGLQASHPDACRRHPGQEDFRLLVSVERGLWEDYCQARVSLQGLQGTWCSGWAAGAELHQISSHPRHWPTVQQPETAGNLLSPAINPFSASSTEKPTCVAHVKERYLKEWCLLSLIIYWRVNMELRGDKLIIGSCSYFLCYSCHIYYIHIQDNIVYIFTCILKKLRGK